MMRSKMARVAMVPTAVHQLPPCITALVSRPLYKCPIHQTNRSIMILVATAIGTAVMENIKTGEWQARFIELSGGQLSKLFSIAIKLGTIRTVTDIINNSNQRTLIDRIHYHAPWFSHLIKWPDPITHKIDEAVRAAKTQTEAIIPVITIANRQTVPMGPTHQTFISCHPKENIQAKLWEFTLIIIRIQNNFLISLFN